MIILVIVSLILAVGVYIIYRRTIDFLSLVIAMIALFLITFSSLVSLAVIIHDSPLAYRHPTVSSTIISTSIVIGINIPLAIAVLKHIIKH